MNPFDKPKAESALGETVFQAVFDSEALLHAFEEAWQSGVPPSIASLLPQLPDAPAAQTCLEELVKIDLEYRWKSRASATTHELPARPLLEDYVRQYSSLGPLEELSLDLIGEEYRVRRLWGIRPEAETYLARFPTRAEALIPLLQAIDAELSAQFGATTLQHDRASVRLDATFLKVNAGGSPDGYEILGELGRGGMGVVYLARQIRLHRLVALKTIGSGQQANADELARFRTEAESAARVQHANVVQVYEVGEQNDQPFCVLEYVNGGSLMRKLAGAPLEAHAAVRLLEILARAVQAVHEHGILHRDLKPANVLLQVNHPEDADKPLLELLNSSKCVPKISDFGLAKPTEATVLTHTGAVLGTPSYMAPEQAEGRTHDIGPAADVYGLGAILYELLTGRPPFRGVNVLETLDQVRKREPVSPRRLEPSVPRDVDTICLKCLQKEPGKRYTSAAALADDLERCRLNRPIQARPVGRWERGRKWARRRPALAALFAVLFLTCLAALAGSIAYTVNLRAAEAETHRQQERSERHYRKSLDAIERMLVDMGAQRMEGVPGTEELQIDALGDAIRLYEELQADREMPDPELLDRLGNALTYLGLLQLNLGHGEEAEESCRRGVALLEDIAKEFPEVRLYRKHLASGRYILGNILMSRDQRDESEQLYLRSLEEWRTLDDGDSQVRVGTMECYAGLATVCADFARCQEYHRQELALGEALHKEKPDDWSRANRLAQGLYNVAKDHLTAGRRDEAETLFLRCSSLLEPLAARGARGKGEQASRLHSRSTLAHCYNGLGMSYAARQEANKSEEFYKKAVTLDEDTIRLYPQPPRWEELAISYHNLAAFYQTNRREKEAESLYRKIIHLRESLVRDVPRHTLNRVMLAESYLNLGLYLGGGTQWKEGFALLQKGRDLMEPLYREHPEDTRYAIALGSNCNNQAYLMRNRGDVDGALPFHNRAVTVLLDAHRRNPTNSQCSYMCAMALGARAVTWMGRKDHQKALVDWDSLMEVVGPVEAEKYRIHRVLSLTQIGEHRRAAEDIDKILRRPGISGDERYNCVCALSHVLAAVSKDARLSSAQRKQAEDTHAARALQVLTQLKSEGYFRNSENRKLLKEDEDLTALRARDDFKHWSEAPNGDTPTRSGSERQNKN